MMFGKSQPEVLVVGAGPVGMLSALALNDRGLDVGIVDSAWRPAARSYALALHSESCRILAGFGLEEALAEAGHGIDRISLYRGSDWISEVRLPVSEGLPVLVLPQSALEERLLSELQRRGVRVRWNHRVAALTQDEDRVTLNVEELGKESTGYSFATTVWVVERRRTLRPRLVVGADGHGSFIRRTLGIAFPEVAPAATFATFEMSGQAPAGEMSLVLDGDLASALWPIADDKLRWSFQLADPSAVLSRRLKSRLSVELGGSHYPHLPEELAGRLIAERAPWFKQPVEDPDWSVAVLFEQRLATPGGQGRVWLLGDAAHLAWPLGAQSMNIGFAEAVGMADAMASVLRRGAETRTIADYANQREARWRHLLAPGDRWHPKPETPSWLRRGWPTLVRSLPVSGDDLTAVADAIGFEQRPDAVEAAGAGS